MIIKVLKNDEDLNLAIGEIIKIEKIKNSDEKDLKVTHPDIKGECFVSRKNRVYDYMKKSTVLAKVIGYDRVVLKYNKFNVERQILVAETMDITMKDENDIKEEKKPIKKNNVPFELSFKGISKKYPNKIKVMNEIKLNGEVTLKLKLEEDNIVSYFEDIPAGVATKKGNDCFEEAFIYVRERGEVEARACSVTGVCYSVKLAEVKQEKKVEVKSEEKNTIVDIKMELVRDKGFDKETIDSIEEYLLSNNIKSNTISKIFKTYKTYEDENIRALIPKLKGDKSKFVDNFGGIRKSIVYMLKGKHLRYVGDKGVGKNKLIETIAWIFQRPLYEVSLNSQSDKNDLQGAKTFDSNVDENGNVISKIVFEKEALVNAMENGAILNLDEANTVDPSVLIQIHSATDSRRTIQVGGYKKVVADDNFAVILTMNTDYEGTRKLNQATNDRFVPIVFPSNNDLTDILKEACKEASMKDIEDANNVYMEIKRMVDEEKLSSDCITVRGFIDALDVVEDLGLEEALIDNIANRVSDDLERMAIEQIIDSLISE